MKYLTFIALISMLAFSSCSKEQTCECSTQDWDTSDPDEKYNSTTTITFTKNAKEKCNDMEANYTSGTYKSETTCKLK